MIILNVPYLIKKKSKKLCNLDKEGSIVISSLL